MTASLQTFAYTPSLPSLQEDRLPALLNGEILLTTRSHTDWGAAVTARMHLPIQRGRVWEKITEYSQWVRYFPALTHSQVLHEGDSGAARITKRLYQVASKTFFLFTAQVDIRLKVVETIHQRIQFYLESGSFKDFYADLHLQECRGGTLLTYSVQATPTIPVPSLFIQQAIQLDLPSNLRNMRQLLCQ
ncbi:SRPBCC family protein [Leptothermofonsia sp. ETS-13]|uniref:SRPBCC family protein n=1 Tax=Leptothermofonsia sp. ETS-13 TaxID=3035696 RepID=UPI003B9F3F7D